MRKRILTLALALLMCMSTIAIFSSCGGKGGKTDTLVIMTDELDGLFNPFFSTAASDGSIVANTQIGMLGSEYVNNDIQVAYGDKHAVVAKDYSIVYNDSTDTTDYYLIIKNGIKFSDGKPLTMNDVIFNMYVYLDPVYTGSSTMYSTDILGLTEYRTQSNLSDSGSADDQITQQANTLAQNRLKELINVFNETLKQNSGTNEAGYDKMVAAIKAHALSDGYKNAISNNPAEITNDHLLADYELALKYFREELNTDYAGAKDAYTEAPYNTRPEFTGDMAEIYSFMLAEGYVTIEYEKDENNKDIKTQIKDVKANFGTHITTKEDAIEYVYNDTIAKKLDQILVYWATAQKLATEFSAKAKEVILTANVADDGSLKIPNISGIVSLGHTGTETEVKGQDGTYKVAKEHNADGTPVNADEYDVLRITIKGVDPKAIWNFAFSVAPHHYYSDPAKYPVDIANNKFGVEFGSFDFMSKVIRSARNIQHPMGAGPYKVSDEKFSDNPSLDGFFKDGVVYFKSNENFLLGTPKTEKLCYQVVSSSNAIGMLESGRVHFITPQFTAANITKLDGLKKQGVEQISTQQLGYGYIGINAGRVPDINLRKAIMSAMNTSLAIQYYSKGTAETIYWPMSTVSWAYPKDSNGNNDKDNKHTYIATNFTDESAKEAILSYMEQAGVQPGDKQLELTFTIAGADMMDHPTYATFQKAAILLNECGWDIDVVPDTQALIKLTTGSLDVWAAAWGSALDPDMYQVYHKNSTATSTLAWGYREILSNPGQYQEENRILVELSNVIDAARETEDRAVRSELYKQAMSYVLDLAVEMPVYQRKVLYAYNSKVIKSESMPGTSEINPYTSPLDRIWEIELVD